MSSDRLRARLRASTVFATANDSGIERLLSRARVSLFAPGDRVLDEGDDSDEVFFLSEGSAGVFYSSRDGAGLLAKVFGAPAIFGEMEVMTGLPRLEFVEALRRCEIATFPGADFVTFLETNPKSCLELLRDVSARLCISAYNERSLAFHSVETRLADLFGTFVAAYGVTHADGISIDIKLNYRTLASCLGVTERSIERTIGKWLKEGWLTRSRSIYAIASPKALEAKSDPERLTLHTRLGLAPSFVKNPG